MMCSVLDVENRREYTRPCANVTHRLPAVTRGWASVDMQGLYDSICPYYDSCALTLDSGKCRFSDLRFTFVGQVGVVTAVNNEEAIPTVMVTFNNNRTSYEFAQKDVELEKYKSQYELWWVVRSPALNTVQKRKGFNITNPGCTFDSVNNRYVHILVWVLKLNLVINVSIMLIVAGTSHTPSWITKETQLILLINHTIIKRLNLE